MTEETWQFFFLAALKDLKTSNEPPIAKQLPYSSKHQVNVENIWIGTLSYTTRWEFRSGSSGRVGEPRNMKSMQLPRRPFFTVRNEVAKVMFLHLSVSDSVYSGVCLSACWDTTLPGSGTPLGPGTPPQKTTTVADGTHPTGMHSCLWFIFTGPGINYWNCIALFEFH